MKKALAKTQLQIKFTEHDLRAKVSSDTDIDHAQKLLGHNLQEVTERVYRRKPEIIKPYV